MKSSFEKEQSNKILSCYVPDISKGGKKAAVGEIRNWGGKRYVKVADGWIKYDHGNKKIDNSRKTSAYTSPDSQKFSHDQVIKEHIEKLSPEERKEQVDKMKKKVEHLTDLQSKIDKHNHSSGKTYVNISSNVGIDKKKEIKKLHNKIAEVEHGHLSQKELETLKTDLADQISDLKKQDPNKNAEKIAELKQQYSKVNHVLYRKFSGTSKDVVLSGHDKQYLDQDALFNDSTPWDEDMWDSEINTEQSDKIIKNLDKQKIDDLNKQFFGKKTFYANRDFKFTGVPEDAQIEVTFADGKTANRTFKQLKAYIEKVKSENPEPKLEKEPEKPSRPFVAKNDPEYKAKWHKYFKEEENIKKIQEKNSALTDKYITANILPISEIKLLALN